MKRAGTGAFALRALLAALLLWPLLAVATLSARDVETQALERRVADDPRAALKLSEEWLAQSRASGDKALLLKATRLQVMATATLEETLKLVTAAEQGLVLARELKDAQAECEFSAPRRWHSRHGKYLDAQPVFDEASWWPADDAARPA
jgi:hypothetical protein